MNETNNARNEGDQQPIEPQVATFDREELTAEVAFTQGPSQKDSDRNLKENVKPADPSDVLSGVLADPAITTFDHAEIATETFFATYTSDRNAKENVKPVASEQVLQGIVAEPAVITFERVELATELAFVQNPSPGTPSDRRIKENVEPVDSQQVLKTFIGEGR